MARTLFLIVLLLMTIGGQVLTAQVRPDHFVEETSPNNSNFETYSQKGGVNRRASMANMRKYFGAEIVNGSTPALSGNGESLRNKIILVLPDSVTWFVDYLGDAVKLGSGLVGGRVYEIDEVADTTTVTDPREGDLAIAPDTMLVYGTSWILFSGGDNWGVQAVEKDSTLRGNGTVGDPLRVNRDSFPTRAEVDELIGVVEDTLSDLRAALTAMAAEIEAIEDSLGNIPDGSGSAGQVAFWEDGNSLSGNANLKWANSPGYLGIGGEPESRLYIRTDGLGDTQSSSSGIVLENTTAAASAAQQISPAIRFRSQGWKTAATAASQPIDWRIYSYTVQSTSFPFGALVFDRDINGNGYNARFSIRSFSNNSTTGIDILGDYPGINNQGFIRLFPAISNFGAPHFFLAGVSTTSNYFGYFRGSTEIMRLNSLGDLGLGTNSPSAKLDVVGDLEVSSRTATATGLAGWAADNKAANVATGSGLSFDTGTGTLSATGDGNGIPGALPVGDVTVAAAGHRLDITGMSRFTLSDNLGLSFGAIDATDSPDFLGMVTPDRGMAAYDVVNSNFVVGRYNRGSGLNRAFSFHSNANAIEVWNGGTGSSGFQGLVYDADNSANFTDRSLIDKGYLESIVSEWKNGIFDYRNDGENVAQMLALLTEDTTFSIGNFTAFPSVDEDDINNYGLFMGSDRKVVGLFNKGNFFYLSDESFSGFDVVQFGSLTGTSRIQFQSQAADEEEANFLFLASFINDTEDHNYGISANASNSPLDENGIALQARDENAGTINKVSVTRPGITDMLIQFGDEEVFLSADWDDTESGKHISAHSSGEVSMGRYGNGDFLDSTPATEAGWSADGYMVESPVLHSALFGTTDTFDLSDGIFRTVKTWNTGITAVGFENRDSAIVYTGTLSGVPMTAQYCLSFSLDMDGSPTDDILEVRVQQNSSVISMSQHSLTAVDGARQTVCGEAYFSTSITNTMIKLVVGDVDGGIKFHSGSLTVKKL